MRSIGILGTGSYLPAGAVPNEPIARSAGVTAEWIERKTGIRERCFAAPHEATSDLAARAASAALGQADIGAQQLDYIVVATSTPDQPQPPTASILQHLIGAADAAVLDVNAVCSGFIYALSVGQSLLQTRPTDGYALVVGADLYSRCIDYSDRKTAVLLGDGAGAVVLGPVPEGRGLTSFALRGYGAYHQLISVPAGGSRMPASEQTVRDGSHFFRMDGHGVRDFVYATLPGAVDNLLQASGLDRSAVAHFVPHQANGVMLAEIWPKLELPEARLHVTVDRFGNTGAASIPITLDVAHRAGSIAEDDIVLMAAFGGGMNIGAALCSWTAPFTSTATRQPAAAAVSA